MTNMDLNTVRSAVVGTLNRAGRGDVEAICWMAVFALAAVLGLLLLEGVLKGDGKSKKKNLPPLYSEGLPIIGNLMGFSKGSVDFVRRGYDAVGDCFTVKLAQKRLTFLNSPGAHAVAFASKDQEVDMASVYRFSVPIFGPGVVYDAEPKERYFHYKMLGTGLSTTKLRSYVPGMIQESQDFFANWGEEGEIDLFTELGSLIIMTASRCLLGKEVREEMFNEVAELITILDHGMQVVSVFAPYLPIEAHRRRDQARRDLQTLFKSVLDKRRASGVKGDDLLQVFMDTTRQDGTFCDDFTIVGLLIAAIFGGQHTSSITSTWCILHLIRDEKLRKEVEEERHRLLESNGGKLDFDVMSQMDTLHYCMKEALRMYPPLIFLMRSVEEERHYNGYDIPVGDILVTSPGVSGRLPQLWTNPETFDPHRFDEERAEDKKARFTFLGFGGGRHSCMGEQFAFLQVKTILTTLFSNYDVEPIGELNKPDYEALVVGPKGKSMVRYRRKKTVA